MTRLAVFLFVAGGMFAQSFEVAAIKPTDPNSFGRTIKMRGVHEFNATGFTVKALIAAAWSLNPQHQILGGPAWTETDRFDIHAGTPGEVQPNRSEQMRMLGKLLAERFQLAFHLEPREMAIYALTVSKTGSKLKTSTAPSDELPELINVVFPDRIQLPARNATMGDFVAMMRRAVLDRPLVDQTGLTARYDFDLEWSPDETQFEGRLPPRVPAEGASRPDLFAAMQQQLGLKLTSTKGLADVLVIDRVERPSAN